MAIIQGTYLSDALKRSITYHVYLPNDTADEMKTEYYERPAKVLYLLIGYSGASIDWVTGSLIFGTAQKYNVTVVMVSGENSFYLNQKGTGRAYEDFAGRELPEYINKTFHLIRHVRTHGLAACQWAGSVRYIQVLGFRSGSGRSSRCLRR